MRTEPNPYEAKARAEKAIRLADCFGEPGSAADWLDELLALSGADGPNRLLLFTGERHTASEATWRTVAVILRQRAREVAEGIR